MVQVEITLAMFSCCRRVGLAALICDQFMPLALLVVVHV